MKRCFIAIILLFIAHDIKAQYGVLGAHIGLGVLGNSNAPYFPGFGGATRYGLTLGLMATDNVGFFTGTAISTFNFGISYDRGTVGTQSVTYLDVPFAIRYVIGGSKNHHALKVYAQPGVTFRKLQHAHYSPEKQSTTKSHTTYETDNGEEFKRSVASISAQGGFILNVSPIADLHFGGELSSATGNTINAGKYSSYGSLQGYTANMHLTHFAVHIGLQFRFGGSPAKTSGKR